MPQGVSPLREPAVVWGVFQWSFPEVEAASLRLGWEESQMELRWVLREAEEPLEGEEASQREVSQEEANLPGAFQSSKP